jgi:hypothetical protein
MDKSKDQKRKTTVSLEGLAHHLLGPSSTWRAPVFSNCQAFSSSISLALHDRHAQPPQKEICYINLLYLSLELTILTPFVVLQQNSFGLWFKDVWILLPVLLLLLLSSRVASERESTEENKQTKNRRKQMTIARLITKELTTTQLLSTPNLHSKKEWQRITPCCGLDLLLINLRYRNRCASSNATLCLAAEAD